MMSIKSQLHNRILERTNLKFEDPVTWSLIWSDLDYTADDDKSNENFGELWIGQNSQVVSLVKSNFAADD